MGTDILFYAEWRQNEAWQFIGEMSENIIYQYDPEHENPYDPKNLYNIRNYDLFAILADVRNGAGYECIAPRRGIPNDLSPEIKSYFEVFQSEETGGELCPGWLTLEELVNFDWHGKRIQRYGIVDKRVTHIFHPDRGFPFREWLKEYRWHTLAHLKQVKIAMPVGPKPTQKQQGQILLSFLTPFHKSMGYPKTYGLFSGLIETR